MSKTVYDRLREKLNSQNIEFDVLEHEPVFTSEQAAEVRGATLASGAKALICKADDRFVHLVMPADRRLASKRLRKLKAIHKLRFATVEEVLELTSLQPGSIPPFGSLFDLPTWCDVRLSEQERINFNAGDHTISINMTYAHYFAAEKPELIDLTDPT